MDAGVARPGRWLLVGTLAGNRRGWFWPLALVLIGTFMLLRDLDVIERSISLWPIVVIALGLAILLEATEWGRSRSRKQPVDVGHLIPSPARIRPHSLPLVGGMVIDTSGSTGRATSQASPTARSAGAPVPPVP
jgi:hypothetical protein